MRFHWLVYVTDGLHRCLTHGYDNVAVAFDTEQEPRFLVFSPSVIYRRVVSSTVGRLTLVLSPKFCSHRTFVSFQTSMTRKGDTAVIYSLQTIRNNINKIPLHLSIQNINELIL